MAKQRSPVTELKEVLAEIRKRNFKPVYLLHGDEPYFANRIAEVLISTVVAEEAKAFNQFLRYGRDVTAFSIHDLALRSPIGSDYLLIVVREAQEIRQVEPLVEYLAHPMGSTILVLCYSTKFNTSRGKSSAAKQLATRVGEVGYIYEFGKLRDYEVAKWIDAQIQARGLLSSPSVTQAIADQLGTDLSTISNELEKLLLVLPEGAKAITLDIVQEAIGLSRDFNVYELTRAIGKGEIARALRIALNIGEQKNGGELPMVIAALFSYFNRLFQVGVFGGGLGRNDLAEKIGVSPYVVDEYMNASNRYPPRRCTHLISYLRMWDLRAKGIGAVEIPRKEVYKEIVTYIMLS